MVGIYVSDHPLSPYTQILLQAASHPLGMLDDEQVFVDGRSYDFAGMVTSIAVKTTKSGNNMAIMQLEDMEGSVECVLFSNTWEKYRDLLQDETATADPVVRVRGKFERSDRGVQVRVFEVNSLTMHEDEQQRAPSALSIRVPQANFSNETMSRLSDLFSMYPGAQPVTLFIEQSDGRRFRAELPVSVNCASKELVSRVESLVGVGAAEVLGR